MFKKRYEIDVDRASSKAIFDDKFDNRFDNKKAQLTIFIILGLVVLLSLVLVIVLKTEVIKFKPEEIIPTQKSKVETFLTSCIEQLGSDALTKIGLQAGYLEVPEDLISRTTMPLRLSPFLSVPYWAYGPDKNVPPLSYIKEEIDDYIEKNLRSCLYQDEAFQESYTFTEKSELVSDTEITDRNVLFNVNWDLDISNKAGDVIAQISQHQGSSPVRLRLLHQTAERIVDVELSELKLEDLTQDLIALEHPDVPVAGFEISCTKKTWNVQKVKSALQELISYNLRQLQVKNTDVLEFSDDFPYYQNHYVWNLGNAADEFSAADVSVSFMHDLSYPFQFQVTPLTGGKLQSSMLGGTGEVSFLCVQNWKFTYDVSYPVLVQLIDRTTGYIFNTAMTVHLIRNFPNRESALLLARPSASVSFADSKDYCDNKRIPMIITTSELVDNPIQGVYDSQPLDDVQLSYTCGKYKCEMGQTIYDFSTTGDQAGIRLNYPYCVGGILRAEKEGFKGTFQRVTAESGKIIDLNLQPLKKYPSSRFKVVKHDFRLDQENMDDPLQLDPAQSLSSGELALITFIHYDTDDQEDHRVEQVLGPSMDEKTLNEFDLEFLGKADFQYEVDLKLFDQTELVGGYKGNWTFPLEALDEGKEIIFHALAEDDEEKIFSLVSDLEKYSKTSGLAPEVK